MIRDVEKPTSEAGLPLLDKLKLLNFRCFHHLELNVPEGLSLFTGQNASGKTTLLEAISYISTGKLLRSHRDRDAVRSDETHCEVSGILSPSQTEISIQIPEVGKKVASINKMSLPKASDLLGRLPTTSITAFDLPLSQGDPASRRMFLDLEIGALQPSYVHKLAIYKRALEQRNSLLKMAMQTVIDQDQFEAWEFAMAESGSYVRQQRQVYFAKLAPLASSTYQEIAKKEILSLFLKEEEGGLDTESLQQAFALSRSHDMRRGSTSLGPHRDDFGMEIDGKDVKNYGSQGQQRSVAIALKAGSFQVSRETSGTPPLLLLDDMLSDLDEYRRTALAALVINQSRQALLTCTEASSVSNHIVSRASVLKVSNGEVTWK